MPWSPSLPGGGQTSAHSEAQGENQIRPIARAQHSHIEAVVVEARSEGVDEEIGNETKGEFSFLGLPGKATAHQEGRELDVDRTLPMEYLVCGIALAAMLAIGVFTEPWLRLTETASQAIALRFIR